MDSVEIIEKKQVLKREIFKRIINFKTMRVIIKKIGVLKRSVGDQRRIEWSNEDDRMDGWS